MGNSGSHSRERHKSGDIPSSPRDSQAFYFSKRKLTSQSSNEDELPFSIDRKHSIDTSGIPVQRPRAATLSQSSGVSEKLLPTMFKWEEGGREVFISGSFSDWKTIPMAKSSHSDFVAIIDLPEGEHKYRFLVDGNWKFDVCEPTTENSTDPNNKYNVIKVKKTDFEVFEALAIDSVGSSNSASTATQSGSPPGDYSQELPNLKPWDKPQSPPILPPHLLQVILNKDTPLSCEPTLLPEPNHVMLNHLYALSIKDGVMVLSATHRYRKKYVTTLLYKPI